MASELVIVEDVQEKTFTGRHLTYPYQRKEYNKKSLTAHPKKNLDALPTVKQGTKLKYVYGAERFQLPDDNESDQSRDLIANMNTYFEEQKKLLSASIVQVTAKNGTDVTVKFENNGESKSFHLTPHLFENIHPHEVKEGTKLVIRTTAAGETRLSRFGKKHSAIVKYTNF